MIEHELTTSKLAQSDPWSSTIVHMSAWLARCSCARWRFTAYDLSTIREAHRRHVTDSGPR